MTQTPYIFNQLCSMLDKHYFDYLVKRHNGNRYVKQYSCWNHLLTMIWAQLTSRKSLRDIEVSLRGHQDKLYRLGFGKSISRATIADANAQRDVAIYRETAQRMMELVSSIQIVETDLSEIFNGLAVAGLFAVDSSTIHLPLSKFPWSVPQRNGGGIKAHAMLDIFRDVPVTCLVTGNEERDQTFMDDYPYTSRCIYLFDKAYVKTPSLFRIHKTGAYFVVRKKENMCIEVVSSDPDANKIDPHVLEDSRIKFSSRWACKGYPEELRLVSYYSAEKNMTLSFLTNNFEMSASMVASAYKNRWAIEMFFRWVKQHLHIETFYGTSANAVSIQIYTAVITYCMVARFADQHKLRCSNYELMRALGVSLTEKRHLCDWVNEFRVDKQIRDEKNLTPSLF